MMMVMIFKNCDGSEILLCLKANKLTCQRFTDAGRTYKMPASVAKDFPTHGTAGDVWFLFIVVPHIFQV